MNGIPRIVSGPHGKCPLNHPELIQPDSTTAAGDHNPLTIGSWLKNDVTDGIRGLETGETSVHSQIRSILLSDGKTPKNNQYLTAAEAASGNYYLEVTPLGGCVIELEEDGDAGNIADSDLAAGKVYANVVVSAPTNSDQYESAPGGVGTADAQIKLDSSSIGTSSSGKLVQILGVASPQGVLESTTALQKRRFRVIINSAAAQLSQV